MVQRTVLYVCRTGARPEPVNGLSSMGKCWHAGRGFRLARPTAGFHTAGGAAAARGVAGADARRPAETAEGEQHRHIKIQREASTERKVGGQEDQVKCNSCCVDGASNYSFVRWKMRSIRLSLISTAVRCKLIIQNALDPTKRPCQMRLLATERS